MKAAAAEEVRRLLEEEQQPGVLDTILSYFSGVDLTS